MYKILQADKHLFTILNGKWHNAFLDRLMPMLRQSEIWLPLYLFLLVFVLLNVHKSGWFILYCICTVAMADILSSHIIKNYIIRTRPCGDPDMTGLVRFLVSYCPQSSSFTSSHATNHFALATFLSITLRPYIGPWIYLSFFWAFCIAYAQIYVGVHFPLDVLGGTVIGILLGYVSGRMYTKKAGHLVLVNN